MRKYMDEDDGDKKKKISIKKYKEEHDNRKFWQFRPILTLNNCCTKSLLKALEGLYIYYYYSIINDEKITFDPGYIYQSQHLIIYFKYLEIIENLSRCYANFEYENLIYDINPYTLINKDNCSLKSVIPIYEEICARFTIPKFNSIEDLNYPFNITKSIDEFYNEYNTLIKESKSKLEPDAKQKLKPPKNIYWVKNDNKYKCYYCDKTYNNVHWWLCDHLEKIHKVKISVKEAREYM
jgi:hypothetical protein